MHVTFIALVNRKRNRRPAVQRAYLVICHGAQLRPSHIPQPHDSTLVVGPENHVPKLLFFLQSTERRQRVLEYLTCRSWRLADLPCLTMAWDSNSYPGPRKSMHIWARSSQAKCARAPPSHGIWVGPGPSESICDVR